MKRFILGFFLFVAAFDVYAVISIYDIYASLKRGADRGNRPFRMYYDEWVSGNVSSANRLSTYFVVSYLVALVILNAIYTATVYILLRRRTIVLKDVPLLSFFRKS